MSKKQKPANIRPVSSSGSRPPRLDGDHLYAWAQMVMQVRQALEAKQQMAADLLQQHGKTPGEFMLSDDGYLVTAAEAERLGRVRDIAIRQTEAEPERPPQISDSAT